MRGSSPLPRVVAVVAAAVLAAIPSAAVGQAATPTGPTLDSVLTRAIARSSGRAPDLRRRRS